VRTTYERVANLDEVFGCLRELQARTVVFDVEPLVALWGSGQTALDEGLALVATRTAMVPTLQVVCFSTNSARRPPELPHSDKARLVYLASAGKPMRITPYRGFPRPGVVVGDQVATDGILAWRLGYAFVQYHQRPGVVPAGPRLMGGLGRLVRPLVFSRRHSESDVKYSRSGDRWGALHPSVQRTCVRPVSAGTRPLAPHDLGSPPHGTRESPLTCTFASASAVVSAFTAGQRLLGAPATPATMRSARAR
jgi:hypothetical protein